jgi:E3 ubiquitin-protein ligase UBR1
LQSTKRFGLQKANEVNDMGRSVVRYSKDIDELLKIAKIIEDIKVTVTIRSARDTFREQMCGTIIEWLVDIAGCSIGNDHDILRQTICEEILKSWRTGSEACNAKVGKNGIDDHEIEEALQDRRLMFAQAIRTRRWWLGQ